MDSLTNLAVEYGTDKWSRKHHYTPTYFELFKDRRKEVKKVLEIGVAEGAGLKMFRDFFPNAFIYGAEIDPKRMFESERIKVYRADQSNEFDLQMLIDNIGTDIDLVIDDGSHRPNDQIVSCIKIFPQLDKGATYIIEDVGMDISEQLAEFNPEVKKVGHRYDDRLIICQK